MCRGRLLSLRTPPGRSNLSSMADWHRFSPQAHVHGNVVLNFTRHPKGDLHIYARAYQEAATALVEVFRAKRYYSDAEACPIVFLYRHAVELYLKTILLWGGGLVRLQTGETLDLDRMFQHHEFKFLLPNVRKVFEAAGWATCCEAATRYGALAEIEAIIMEIEEIDPNSFAFRYPVDRKGVAPLPEQFHFNVVALGKDLDLLLRALDGAAEGVYEQFQFLAREYQSMR